MTVAEERAAEWAATQARIARSRERLARYVARHTS